MGSKYKGNNIGLTVLACLITIFIITGASFGQSSIGVKNTPPTFTYIDIKENGNYHLIETEISDYNGRNDIYRVEIQVLDEDEDIIANFSYSQYETNNKTSPIRIDTFSDEYGDYLVREDCEIERYVGSNWFKENTTLKIFFVVNKLYGDKISIRAYDMNMESGYYEGPIKESTEVRTIIKGRAIPLAVSFITAALGSAVVVFDRMNKNKLAQLAKNKMEKT